MKSITVQCSFLNNAFFLFSRQTIFRTRTQNPEFLREIICNTALQIILFSFFRQNKNSKIKKMNFHVKSTTLLLSKLCNFFSRQTIFRTRTQNPEFLREINYTTVLLSKLCFFSFFRQTIFRTKTQNPEFVRELVKPFCSTAL